MKAVLLFPLILTLFSCNGGGGSSSKSKKGSSPVVIDVDAAIDGQYLAVFETINPQLTSRITGAFTFSRDTDLDELVTDIRITNAGTKVIHSQYIRSARRCPTPLDDINADGIIDGREGEKVYGKIFVPLDGDIGSQTSHDGEFPVGDNYGNYIWAKVTKFSDFIKDLRSTDESSDYIKLKIDEPLKLEGRAVVIHGIDQNADLPPTVVSNGPLSPYQTLPVACGIIKKILDTPGEIDDGTIISENE